MSHDRNSEIAVLEAMGANFFNPPEFTAVQAAVKEITDNVAVRRDNEAPWGEGNRATCRVVMTTAPTRFGKTALGQQIANGREDLQSLDGVAIQANSIYVECPSLFTPALFYNLVLRQLMGGAGTKRMLPAAAAFDRVDTQLPVHMPTLLVLDEFQYIFTPTGVSEKRKAEVAKSTVGFVRRVLDHALWPVPVLLMGTPELARELGDPEYKFLNEKITPIQIAPMRQGSEKEFARLRMALDTYCDDAGIKRLAASDDLLKRVIHATDHARGLAFELFQASVMTAWRNNRRPLEESDFTDRYRLATGSPDDQNPFIVHGWQNTNRSRLMEQAVRGDLQMFKAGKV